MEILPNPLSPLPREFYLPSAEVVAPLLLGHYLVRVTPEGIYGGRIVETEAYLAHDPACHAYKRESPRNRSMWGAPGHAYVYQIYGMHYCFNAVCQEKGTAEAVLVRAIDSLFGVDEMQARRGTDEANLTNGPAKLCSALQIGRALDGIDICSQDSELIIARNPDLQAFITACGPVIQTTRIGITQAADWPLRWYLDGSRAVSKRVARRKAR